MNSLSNTYLNLPESFYKKVKPAFCSNPQLIQFNDLLAREIGLDFSNVDKSHIAQIFSGQKLLTGSEPISLAYAGHQFGHFVPQLGDGRALLLGESNGFDIQLKGSGQTPFSRGGDGKAPLGAVLREYIVSEAIHHLGVPTTRALCAIKTEETLFRQAPEPGGILTRVAPSHIRVGTFEYFAHRGDHTALEKLLNYAIQRHYPELSERTDTKDKALSFIQSVGEAQAQLIAQWMSVGFIHGVMNTDNSAIGGFTIDYGPCAFMDNYKKHQVFSSIDRNGRYSFDNQVAIGQWNLLRLVDCLLPLVDENINVAASKIEPLLIPTLEQFPIKKWQGLARKLGLSDYTSSDNELIETFLTYLEEEELDFTLSFRRLPELYNENYEGFNHTQKLNEFIAKWKNRTPSVENLKNRNPLFIPRNHQIELAIQQAYSGDYQIFNELLKVTKTPFKENSQLMKYSLPPSPEQRIKATFCGT